MLSTFRSQLGQGQYNSRGKRDAGHGAHENIADSVFFVTCNFGDDEGGDRSD